MTILTPTLLHKPAWCDRVLNPIGGARKRPTLGAQPRLKNFEHRRKTAEEKTGQHLRATRFPPNTVEHRWENTVETVSTVYPKIAPFFDPAPHLPLQCLKRVPHLPVQCLERARRDPAQPAPPPKGLNIISSRRCSTQLGPGTLFGAAGRRVTASTAASQVIR